MVVGLWWRWLLVVAQATAVLSLYLDANETSLILKDSRTGMIARTLFLEESTTAIVDGLLWKDSLNSTGTEILRYRTLLNGDKVNEGYMALPTDPLELPTSLDAGKIFAEQRGNTVVKVEFWIDERANDSVEVEVRAIRKWMASIPMIVIFVLGFLARLHVIYTLVIGLFVGGCMVTGSFIDGFKAIITTYIIDVASEASHVYM